jgi:ADP-heptose:LPS heptosyltransferase
MIDSAKICIIKNDKVGDLILTCPLIQTIKQEWPESHVSVIVNELTYPLIKRLDAIDEAIIDYRQQFRVSAVFLLKKIVSELKKHQFDYIFFSHLDPLYVIAARLAGIKYRVGDGNNLIYSRFMNKKVSISWHDFTKHEIEQQLRFLEPFLKNKISIADPKFNFDDELDNEVIELLGNDVLEKGYIVIHPGYGEGNRGWTAHNYAKLIDLIHTNSEFQVVITGSQKEKDIIDVIVESCQTSPINLNSKTTIEHLLVIINKSKCVIGTETGPLHIAAMCKRPVISISPTKYTKSFRWGPYGTNHVVIKNTKHCPIICHTYKKQCTKDYCLKPLLVDPVYKAVNFIMEQDTFPRNQLYYWFKTSGTVALFIDNFGEKNKNKNYLNSIITLLKEASIHWVICTTQNDVFKDLSAQYDNVFRAHHFNINKWVDYFSKNDASLIHAITPLKSWWITGIKKLIALKIDREPVVISQNLECSTIQALLDYYLNQSKKLSLIK